MSVYYITIFLVMMFCGFAEHCDYKTVQLNVLKQTKHKQMTFICFALAAAILIFVAGFRYYVGSDYVNYYINYRVGASEFWERLVTFNEPGYYFICWLAVALNGNGATVIFVVGAITIFLYLRTIYKNTDNLFVATLLYIFLGCWHGSFNGIRQYLAAAIIFAGIRFIKERKFWKYALVVFLAFLFHASAVIMIFAYFIAYNRINLQNIIILVIGSIVLLFSFNEVLELAGFILDQEYTISSSYITNSVSALRILVAVAPALFFLSAYQNQYVTEEQKFWLNMLILNGIVMVATSNSTYLARTGIYAVSFSAIGIPELLKGLSNQNKRIVKIFLLVMYAAFWWYEVSKSGALNNFQFVFGK